MSQNPSEQPTDEEIVEGLMTSTATSLNNGGRLLKASYKYLDWATTTSLSELGHEVNLGEWEIHPPTFVRVEGTMQTGRIPADGLPSCFTSAFEEVDDALVYRATFTKVPVDGRDSLANVTLTEQEARELLLTAVQTGIRKNEIYQLQTSTLLANKAKDLEGQLEEVRNLIQQNYQLREQIQGRLAASGTEMDLETVLKVLTPLQE